MQTANMNETSIYISSSHQIFYNYQFLEGIVPFTYCFDSIYFVFIFDWVRQFLYTLKGISD